MRSEGPAPDETDTAKGPAWWKRMLRWGKTASAVIAAVGVAAAGIGYITDGVEFFTGVGDYFEDRTEVRSLIAAADERLTRSDFEAAWQTNAKALGLAPSDTAAEEQQAKVAMKWLESLRAASDGKVVDPLKAVLIERLADTKGRERADVRAHIGWANLLLSRGGGPQTDIAAEFDAAIAEDPGNAYAHAMRGYWLLLSSRGPIDTARADLDLALTSTIDPSFSDGLIMSGLTSRTSDDFMLGAIEYANKIREAGRTIDAGTKKTLLWYYSIGLRDMELLAKISALLPLDKQTVFLDWLRQAELADRDKRIATYFMALFAERAGNRDSALGLYRELVSTSPGATEDLFRLSETAVRRLQ